MITERLMKLGSFSIRLRDTSRIDELTYFGTIVVVAQRILNPSRVSDADLLAAASYSGILREKRLVTAAGKRDELALGGHGPEGWLADEEGKGYVYETERAYSGDTFANVINRSGSAPFGLLRNDAGALVVVKDGVINTVAGTYTGTHKFQNQRDAIRYVCEVFGAEYRVNPDFTIDAGTEAQLFVTTPTAIAVRREALGDDPNFDGIPYGTFSTVRDIKHYASRVLLLGEGTGGTLITGAADDASVPYTDPVNAAAAVRVAVISESETESGNANTRAQIVLDARGDTRDAVSLSPADFDVDGVVAVGDTIYVFDPEGELVDTTNEARFRGRALPAAAIRCLGMTWPVTEGMGVYYRKNQPEATGRWIDLSDLVIFETGTPTLEVGAVPRSTRTGDPQTIAGKIFTEGAGDAAVPDEPAHTATPWATASYVDGEGRTRAQISVSWSQPLNTDGSTIVDGSHYTIRWRRNGETDYQYASVGFDVTAFLLQDLAPGVTYEISVEAVDMAVPPNRSGYLADESVVASADTVAPSTPAAPAVAASELALQVTHTLGKASGGTFNLETDLDHLNIYISTVSGFTPSAANLAGKLQANAGHLALGIKVIGTFPIADTTLRYVKVTAVDKAGNESAASTQASASATLIDTVNIADAAITTALIGDLQVTNAKIQALAVTNAKIANAAVTSAKIANATITNAKIANAAITSAKIANAQVSRAKIQALAVSDAEIDNAAVTSAKIADAAIESAKIANAAITNAKIANTTIQDAKIADLTVDKLTGGDLQTTEIFVKTTLTMGSSGVFRSAASGQRVEIASVNTDRIAFHSGAVAEVAPAHMFAADFLGVPYLGMRGPTANIGTSPTGGWYVFYLDSDSDDADHPQIQIGHDGPATKQKYIWIQSGLHVVLGASATDNQIVTDTDVAKDLANKPGGAILPGILTKMDPPTWRADTTNPTATAYDDNSVGYWIRVGNVVFFWIAFIFNSSGVSSSDDGSGDYYWSPNTDGAPTPAVMYLNAENRQFALGPAMVKGSGSTREAGYCEMDTSSPRIYGRLDDRNNRVSNSNPFAFDESDAFHMSGFYYTEDIS